MPSEADLFLVCPVPRLGRDGLKLINGESNTVSLNGCGAEVSAAPFASQYFSRISVCVRSTANRLELVRIRFTGICCLHLRSIRLGSPGHFLESFSMAPRAAKSPVAEGNQDANGDHACMACLFLLSPGIHKGT